MTVAVALRRAHGATAEVVGWCRGELEPGESPARAAARLVADAVGTAGDVWAVDLSGSPAWFAADVPDGGALRSVGPADGPVTRVPPVPLPDRVAERVARIPAVTLGFRVMTRADFDDVVSWQAQPHVARWWQGEARDRAAAEQHYGPALDGRDPTRMSVLEVNGRSVGMLQDYLVGDHPDFALLTAQPEAVGIDYLIGDPAWVGRGVGTRMLWTFLRDVVRERYPAASTCFAAPDHRNHESLRVLDKLGFRRGLWFDEPQADGRVETMVGCSLDLRGVLG